MRAAYAARTLIPEVASRAQDGGFVTSLLIAALEEGTVEAALVVSSSSEIPLLPHPILASSRREVIEAAGSKYAYTPILSLLGEACSCYDAVALVGLPCHLRALRLLSSLLPKYAECVKLAIGLFCYENFTRDALRVVGELIGTDLDSIVRVSIRGRWVEVKAKARSGRVPLESLEPYTRPVCLACSDYLACLSDVSVGGTGSAQGWSTVLVWSERGMKAIEACLKRGYIELRTLSKESLNRVYRVARLKRARAERYLRGI